MAHDQATGAVGPESIITLDKEVDISIQCFHQEARFYWRVEIRLADEIMHARMFLFSKDALAFARELKEKNR